MTSCFPIAILLGILHGGRRIKQRKDMRLRPLEIEEYASDEKRTPGKDSGTEQSEWR